MNEIKERGFEDFLKDMHMRAEPTVLDDELPDAFEHWFTNLNADEYMKLGNLYGREQRIVGAEKMSKHLLNTHELVMSAFK